MIAYVHTCLTHSPLTSTFVRMQDFGLTIDIEELIDNVDKDGSGEIEFGEFKELLTKSQPAA